MTQAVEADQVNTVVINALEPSRPVRRLSELQRDWLVEKMTGLISDIWEEYGDRIYQSGGVTGGSNLRQGAQNVVREFDQDTTREDGIGLVTALRRQCEQEFGWGANQSHGAVIGGATKAIMMLKTGIHTVGGLTTRGERFRRSRGPIREGGTYHSKRRLRT